VHFAAGIEARERSEIVSSSDLSGFAPEISGGKVARCSYLNQAWGERHWVCNGAMTRNVYQQLSFWTHGNS
jgi:hypothetical protein